MSEHFEVTERGNILTFTPKTPELCSNVYLVGGDTFIDLGNPKYTPEIAEELITRSIYPKTIKRIFYTHLHFDHVGDSSIFGRAHVYATKESIDALKKTPEKEIWLSYARNGTNEGAAGRTFQQQVEDGKVQLLSIDDALANAARSGETLKHYQSNGGGYFPIPGHTQGSCAIMLSEGIFLGDSFGHTKAPTATNNSQKKRFLNFIRNYCVQTYKGHEGRDC